MPKPADGFTLAHPVVNRAVLDVGIMLYEIREINGTCDTFAGAWQGDTTADALDTMARRVGYPDFATARSGPWQHLQFLAYPLLPDCRRASTQPEHY